LRHFLGLPLAAHDLIGRGQIGCPRKVLGRQQHQLALVEQPESLVLLLGGGLPIGVQAEQDRVVLALLEDTLRGRM
jgi:hypothetical protein